MTNGYDRLRPKTQPSTPHSLFMNIYNHVWLFFLSLLVLQGVHARDVSFQAHQRGHHDLVALEPVAHNPQTARHLLQLGQGVNEGT